MQPAHALGRAHHDLDVLRHHTGTASSHAHENASLGPGGIFPNLPIFFGAHAGDIMTSLLKQRSAASPKQVHEEAKEILGSLILINDALGALLESDMPGLLLEGIPLTPAQFLDQVLARGGHSKSSSVRSSPSFSLSPRPAPLTNPPPLPPTLPGAGGQRRRRRRRRRPHCHVIEKYASLATPPLS